MTNSQPQAPPQPTPAALRKVAEEKLREFVVSWPLYRRLRLQLGEPQKSIPFPAAIAMPCADDACKSQPTTTWKQDLDNMACAAASPSTW